MKSQVPIMALSVAVSLVVAAPAPAPAPAAAAVEVGVGVGGQRLIGGECCAKYLVCHPCLAGSVLTRADACGSFFDCEVGTFCFVGLNSIFFRGV